MNVNWRWNDYQHLFRMRMRAAWLRLVGGFPYTISKRSLEPADIEKYLAAQGIRNIEIKQGSSEYKTHDLKKISDLTDNNPDSSDKWSRLLVPGACMSGTPYRLVADVAELQCATNRWSV